MDERIVFRQNFSYLVVKMYKIYSLSTSFNGFFSNALKDKNATDGLMRKISSLSLSLSQTQFLMLILLLGNACRKWCGTNEVFPLDIAFCGKLSMCIVVVSSIFHHPHSRMRWNFGVVELTRKIKKKRRMILARYGREENAQ